MGKKVIAVFIILVAIVGFFLGYAIFFKPEKKAYLKNAGIGEKESANNEIANQDKTSSGELSETTGDSDQITSEVIKQLQIEEDKFLAEEGESGTAAVDQQTLVDFGQSYDENEF